jgi:hypothetical protein
VRASAGELRASAGELRVFDKVKVCQPPQLGGPNSATPAAVFSNEGVPTPLSHLNENILSPFRPSHLSLCEEAP